MYFTDSNPPLHDYSRTLKIILVKKIAVSFTLESKKIVILDYENHTKMESTLSLSLSLSTLSLYKDYFLMLHANA